jgi:quinol monooxygenase YgiN
MIRLRGHLLCQSDADLAIVQKYLPDHIALSRAEPGCLSFDVTQSDDPMVWEVMESFRTRADFDTHQTRTRASAWWEASRDIPRAFRMEEVGD